MYALFFLVVVGVGAVVAVVVGVVDVIVVGVVVAAIAITLLLLLSAAAAAAAAAAAVAITDVSAAAPFGGTRGEGERRRRWALTPTATSCGAAEVFSSAGAPDGVVLRRPWRTAHLYSTRSFGDDSVAVAFHVQSLLAPVLSQVCERSIHISGDHSNQDPSCTQKPILFQYFYQAYLDLTTTW